MNRQNILKVLGMAGLLTLLLWLPSEGTSFTAADTLIGCLTPGQNPGVFYIATPGSDKMTEVLSTENLTGYAGKHVKLSGTWETKGDSKSFRATRIEVIAETCPSGG